MIELKSVKKQVIRNHYDISTLFYRLLWGPHIHHGYWEAEETPRVAQEQLTRRLANLASIKPESVVYDIGCGMGGSSIWLAQNLSCAVTGVTLSPVQQKWASSAAALKRIRPRPTFRCADAELIEFPDESADIVWSIECTEHLFDKSKFFNRAARWLKPGGRFALLAWLAGDSPLTNQQTDQVLRVCEGMFCPSLGNQADYVSWFEQSGLRVVDTGIWTRQVEQTWEICRKRVERTGVRYLAKVLGQNHVLFLDHFDAILNAYKSGAMEYGYFIAEKP
ncbi:MAG: methyltransferase domain-containing protein [Pirellula sp.]|nr:methyltransferase domain-containing protein [Pirellula sp.]